MFLLTILLTVCLIGCLTAPLYRYVVIHRRLKHREPLPFTPLEYTQLRARTPGRYSRSRDRLENPVWSGEALREAEDLKRKERNYRKRLVKRARARS